MSADSSVDQGHLNPNKLASVLAGICARYGLDGRDAELIKFTNNAVFRLPRAAAVVRIAGSDTMRRRITKLVDVARWLAQHSVPAVRLLPDVDQPVVVDGHHATLWIDVPATGPKPDGAQLAEILRQFHALPAPDFDLPPFRPLDEVRQRLVEPEGLADVDLAFLLERCASVETQLGELRPVLPTGPIHGDPFMGNLIPGPHGPIICDFDATCHGPREWDLTPVAVGKLRFDYPDDTHSELADRYGFDVLTWEGFPVLREVRELKLVTSVIPILHSNPTIHAQWRHRLDTFKADDTAATWTTYR